jgi:GNAT superfamily N-acetyltransferase
VRRRWAGPDRWAIERAEGGTTVRSDIKVFDLGVSGFVSSIEEFVAVYAAAMRAPDEQLAGRRAIMAGHVAYPGFRALAASSGQDLAGFCYGFHGAVGQWWHDRVSAALTAADGATAARTWLANCLEVAELHVRPVYQGGGIGSALLTALASERPERTAVLSTQDTESTARRLYRGVGFTDLLTAFRFDGYEPPYAIMGAELPLRARSASPSR